MGFLSFNMAFYRAELRRLAETPPTVAAIYRARTLLKMLDDLADEDYTTLNREATATHGCGIICGKTTQSPSHACSRSCQAAILPMGRREFRWRLRFARLSRRLEHCRSRRDCLV